MQETAQPLDGVMHGAAGDAGQVIHLLAGAAHPAHLLDDALLFHALEEVHPLDGQYLGVQALAEHRKGVQLQGTDSALGRSRRPGGHPNLYPLPGQCLEGAIGGHQVSSLAGLFADDGVLAVR